MSYGILAHTVGKWPLQQLTEKLSIYGLDFVQLALSKAISDIDLDLGKPCRDDSTLIDSKNIFEGINEGEIAETLQYVKELSRR
jgi:hypothetical protein